MAFTNEQADAAIEGLASRGMVIGDERRRTGSGGTYAHHDPASGRLQAEVPVGGADDVDAAVAAARAALPAWRATPPPVRAAMLLRLADLLEANGPEAAAINARDNGCPISILDSGSYTANWARHYAGWVDKIEGRVIPMPMPGHLDYTRPEPYGVIAALVPWNGPMMGMGQKAIPALAAGNTVVAKPPEIAPWGAVRFAELAMEAGIPPGVVNVVPGGAATGELLVRHRGVDKISFTGGVVAARAVMAAAAEQLTPLCFELGGKSANIVFPDADLDMACTVAGLLGAVMLSGQGCALPTRLYAHADVFDEVLDRVVALAESVAIGDPLDPGTLMGPLVNAAARDRVMGVIERAKASGRGRLVTGGERMGGELAGGYYIAPTVFADVDDASDLARDEVFGPVLSVMRFTDEDDVVARANASNFGLGGYVFTRDLGRAHRMAERLEVGAVTVNAFPYLAPNAPFGGVKDSGFGREGGEDGLREFLRPKNVLIGLG
jgi:acyl-CoA reductase-like NAD-dependent aldehyde dehydrogenase